MMGLTFWLITFVKEQVKPLNSEPLFVAPQYCGTFEVTSFPIHNCQCKKMISSFVLVDKFYNVTVNNNKGKGICPTEFLLR